MGKDNMIRKAEILDAHKIVPLWVKLQESTNLPFVRTDIREQERFYLNIINQIAKSDSFVAVSEVDGEINGFIHGRVVYKDYGNSEPILMCDGVYIEPRGEGMKLIEAMEEWGEVAGIRHFMGETIYDDRLAKIWARRGYKAVQIVYHRED
jgi:hypothetical protein